MVLNDDIVPARPKWGTGKCRSGGVVIQFVRIKKFAGASRRPIRVLVVLLSSETGACLVNEALCHNSSSFPVPQTTPPITEARSIHVRGRSIQLVGSTPAPSLTVGAAGAGSSVPRVPVVLLTLLRLVRISARPRPQP